jgi:uncharacterized protein
LTLQDFFQMYPKVALAFSGGVDSSFLLYMSLKCGADVRAYYVKTQFQPQFELRDARKMAGCLKANLTVVKADILESPEIASNPADRCYYCKKTIISIIRQKAADDGYGLLIDGTNASDCEEDRPGMRALGEMSVLSPLRECGLTKDDIRKLSKEAGLFTWNKPDYSCLATRIPAGEVITNKKLESTEIAEDYLHSCGFKDCRVRLIGNNARIQLPASQIPSLIEHREAIVEEFKKYYCSVLLDLEGRDG